MFSTSGIKCWNRAWKKKIFIKGRDGDNREATHRLLDRGNLHVSWDLAEEFHKKYAADLAAKIPNYICELKSPIFRMFLDFDVYDIEIITMPVIQKWVQSLQSVIKDFYGHEMSVFQMRTIISNTNVKKNVKHNNEFVIKVGVHLVWPELYVNSVDAKVLRRAFIQKLEQDFGPRPRWNIWEEVIDESVYNPRGNGLRMIGSHKWSKCPSCKGKREVDGLCPVNKCLGLGFYDEGRAYKLYNIIDGDGNALPDLLDEYTDDELRTIKDTSIRSPLLHVPIKMVDPLPEWFNKNFFEFKDELFKKSKFYEDKHDLTPEDYQGASELGILQMDGSQRISQKISERDKKFANIRKLVHEIMPDVYKQVEIIDVHFGDSQDIIEKILKLGNNNYSGYYIARTNNSFCMNVLRPHNSNTIYFLITEHGIYQRCFCRCDTGEGRRFGKCKDYKSTRYKYDVAKHTSIINALFPNRNQAFENVIQMSEFKEKRMFNPMNPRLFDPNALYMRKYMEWQEMKDYLIGKVGQERQIKNKKKV